MPTSLVGVNTLIPNRLSKKSISSGKIQSLTGYQKIRTEVAYGNNSRIDLLLEDGNEQCFVEVKNCTLVEDGIAYFPDAVTSRGLKHLVELQRQVREKNRAVMFYLIQRMDADGFRPAHHIDPAYSQEIKRAVKNGVEIIVYDVLIDLEGISLNRKIPYEI